MTRNEANLYRWEDAEELKPNDNRSDVDTAGVKMMQKLAEMLLTDDNL